MDPLNSDLNQKIFCPTAISLHFILQMLSHIYQRESRILLLGDKKNRICSISVLRRTPCLSAPIGVSRLSTLNRLLSLSVPTRCPFTFVPPYSLKSATGWCLLTLSHSDKYRSRAARRSSSCVLSCLLFSLEAAILSVSFAMGKVADRKCC